MPLDLVGAYEIGQMLGVSRQRVQQLRQRPDWPEGVKLQMGTVYERADIATWAREHDREIREDEDGGNERPGPGRG
jgi:hypothetical protein